MSEQRLNEFPQGTFSAFSTAKMSHFLPVRKTLNQETLAIFFGADANNVRMTSTGLSLRLPGTASIRATYGDIIVHSPNGKYKVIDPDYYAENFNSPLPDFAQPR